MASWNSVNTNVLNQGDLLKDIAIPLVLPSFPDADEKGQIPINIAQANIIIMSQSCDLEQQKIANVVVTQIYSLDQFEQVNPSYKSKGRWPEVARGRVESLHLLPPTEQLDDPRSWLVVDFREIASLPVGYVERFASVAGDRWRLQSPYVEHLSQAFARFFMRVALPFDAPKDFSKAAR
ncbi:MAG: hypothetical protein ACLPKB_03190 [Xanthobacteraceae bacterium]